MNTQPAREPNAEHDSAQLPDYSLSEAGNRRITPSQAIAALAPHLTESELRIMSTAVAIAESNAGRTFEASTRALSERCRISTNSVMAALATLTEHGHITKIAEKPNKGSVYRVNFFATIPFSVSVVETLIRRQGVSVVETLNLFEAASVSVVETRPVSTSVSTTETPETENQSLTGNLGPLDIKTDSILKIDRVIDYGKTQKHDTREIALTQSWMYKLMSVNGPHKFPPKPDAIIAGKVLNVAPWPRIEALMRDLMNEETKIGDVYGWFVTVAAQRILGILPERLSERRAELKLIRSQGKAKAAKILAEPKTFREDLLRAAAAGVKKL